MAGTQSTINNQASAREEIFDRLSKAGTKQQKLQDYEKIKEIYELSECTFKPQIKGKVETQQDSQTDRGNQSRREQEKIWQRLHHESLAMKEQVIKMEREKQQQELKNCTFSPQINRKAAGAKSVHRDPLETQASQELKDPYTRLYEKQKEYQ